jgi:hypothetical protein
MKISSFIIGLMMLVTVNSYAYNTYTTELNGVVVRFVSEDRMIEGATLFTESKEYSPCENHLVDIFKKLKESAMYQNIGPNNRAEFSKLHVLVGDTHMRNTGETSFAEEYMDIVMLNSKIICSNNFSDELVEYIIAHEIGHQLSRYTHPDFVMAYRTHTKYDPQIFEDAADEGSSQILRQAQIPLEPIKEVLSKLCDSGDKERCRALEHFNYGLTY